MHQQSSCPAPGRQPCDWGRYLRLQRRAALVPAEAAKDPRTLRPVGSWNMQRGAVTTTTGAFRLPDSSSPTLKPRRRYKEIAPHPSADPIDVYVGRRIRMLRVERGISQSALGAHLGMSFQQIQKYESGKNRISASMLYRACGLLKCRPADLFPERDDPTTAPG
jgi:DNA-binding Xre family transcriptional regulator